MVFVSSVHHLVLFICHLFIDGNFRTAHFLYKPNTFDFDWLLEIDAVCPEPIPLYLTDITLPWAWPWSEKNTPDNVLQLNFFDPIHLTEDIDQLKKGYAHYCIFSFSSVNMNDTKQQDSIFKTLRGLPDSKTLIVQYNTKNVSVFIRNKRLTQQHIFLVNHKTNFKHVNLYERTFGEFERMQSLAIHRVKFSQKSILDTSWEHGDIETFCTHYYHLQLNNSYINMTWFDRTNAYCILEAPNYYKELSTNYKFKAKRKS